MVDLGLPASLATPSRTEAERHEPPRPRDDGDREQEVGEQEEEPDLEVDLDRSLTYIFAISSSFAQMTASSTVGRTLSPSAAEAYRFPQSCFSSLLRYATTTGFHA